MFESESDSAHFFRPVWILRGQWDTSLAYLFQEGEQIGDSVAGAGPWVTARVPGAGCWWGCECLHPSPLLQTECAWGVRVCIHQQT